MRLLLVTETFPPEINGVARTLGRWVTAFETRGHDVCVVRPRRRGESSSPRLTPSLTLPWYREVRCGLPSPVRLLRLLARLRPDLVHVATEGPLGLSAVLACGWLLLPLVTSFHTNFDQYLDYYGLGPLRGLGKTYLRWFHNRAAITLVPSRATQQRLHRMGIERVEQWTRGVDAQAFHPCRRDPELRRQLGLAPDDVLLLYVGRLAREKNLPELVAAYDRLQQGRGPKEPKICLALVGGGPLAGRLQRQQRPGIIFAGVQVGSALARWYASADVFVFPSLSETFGNVVLEARASGLPVVAFDSPGVNEQVQHGVSGLLVPPGQDLAAALDRLCREPVARRQMGIVARQDAESQAWEPIFDTLEQQYVQLAGRTGITTPWHTADRWQGTPAGCG